MANGQNDLLKEVAKIDGKSISKLSPLSAGDHTITLADNHEFLMHVPKSTGKVELPVMFVFSGSEQPVYDPKQFGAETGMNKKADDPNHPFIAVYPLPELHDLGRGSNTKAYAWNAQGALIDKSDMAHAGYDDLDYIKQIVGLVPSLADADAKHKDWAATGFSQGGLFLNKIVTEIPNLFPSVFPEGTAMEQGIPYNVAPGNAKDVGIFELLGDQEVLPAKANEDFVFKAESVLRNAAHALHADNWIETLNPLAAIHNEREDEDVQEPTYAKMMGKKDVDYTVETQPLPDSPGSSNASSDWKRTYTAKSSTQHDELTVYGFPSAHHSWVAPDYGVRSDSQPKYTGFDTTQAMVNQWLNFLAK